MIANVLSSQVWRLLTRNHISWTTPGGILGCLKEHVSPCPWCSLMEHGAAALRYPVVQKVAVQKPEQCQSTRRTSQPRSLCLQYTLHLLHRCQTTCKWKCLMFSSPATFSKIGFSESWKMAVFVASI